MAATALTLSAPAKLNLFLHILGQRDDGYHNLQSVFQFLNYADTLKFELTPDTPEVELLTKHQQLNSPDNLILRAAKLLQETTDQPLPGVRITLHKRIPIGGGLGGGSSDAATTLLGLRQLWNLPVSDADLMALGLQLGADVPVFVKGLAAFANGVGEDLQPLEPDTAVYLVIHPNIHISTASIFQHPKLTRDSKSIEAANWRFETTRNDCQELVCQLYPEVAKALGWLLEYAPARLTGTGACVFGRFTSHADAARALSKLPNKWHGFIARGLNQSPVCQQLRQASMSDPTTKLEV